MKRIVAMLLVLCMAVSLAACAGGGGASTTAPRSEGPAAPASPDAPDTVPEGELSDVRKIILEAQTMSLDELARKAIEESNGGVFRGVGISSRCRNAFPKFIEYLRSIDSSYNMEYDWQPPVNNKIYDQLCAEGQKKTGTFSMVLINNGTLIQSRLVSTGILDTFIPMPWADANGINVEDHKGFLTLQTQSKVFEYSAKSEKVYDNCWDFVAPEEHGLFVDITTDPAGKNFLCMLTRSDYAAWVREAFEALSTEEQAYFQPVIDEVAPTAADMNLGEDGAYALAWIKLWVESYNAVHEAEDANAQNRGPYNAYAQNGNAEENAVPTEPNTEEYICNILVDYNTADQFGLVSYAQLRNVNEYGVISSNNMKVAAYQDGYVGFGGYGYDQYVFVTDNAPMPWTACAFIAYLTCTVDGFSPWGKDMGGYASNPKVDAGNEAIYHHAMGGMSEEGEDLYPAKNDRGISWWKNSGKLVMEDPEYCTSVASSVGSWIELLTRYNAE